MRNQRDTNCARIRITDGGLTTRKERRTSAELEYDRALRAVFVAMQDRHGRYVNRNFNNVAKGRSPWRTLMRRFKEAKAARNDAHNYPLMQEAVDVLRQYVETMRPLGAHSQSQMNVTGEFDPPRAPAQRKRA